MAMAVAHSTITCPACGNRETLAMPVDACLFFHDCAVCGVRLRPKPNDCCVFCSYGSVPCPPKQLENYPVTVPESAAGKSTCC